MPEAIGPMPGREEQQMDRRLLASMACSVSAAAIEVILGYTAAHHVVATASKTGGYLVSLLAFVLCNVAAVLAWQVRNRMNDADDTRPHHGRRLFMANLNLLTASLVALLVVAGTLVLVFLRPDA